LTDEFEQIGRVVYENI